MGQRRYRWSTITIGFILFWASGSFAQSGCENEFNCFSIIVGKDASEDGSVLVAHNEDDGGRQLVNYYRVPRQKHTMGDSITLSTSAVIPQVVETWSFMWLEMPGMDFADCFLNEWGVVVASDACGSRERNPKLTDGGIKYWLRRLMAERARTAKEGVRIAGKLIAELGYASSGRTYVVADPNEGWMLCAVYGKHWVAQRVPDDKVAVLPNYYTVGEVDLADTCNFLGSKDLVDYAVEQEWYDPEQDGVFHFAKVYSSPGNLKHQGNVQRKWRGVTLLAGENYGIDDDFAFAVKPKKKVAVQDLMRVLRDHYEGTELDKTEGYTLGSPHRLGRGICANSTQFAFVAQLRNWMPVEIGAVLWLAQYHPCTQAFIPWYSGMDKMPDGYGYAYGDFNSALAQHFEPPDNIHEETDTHAFWAFVTLAQKVDDDFGVRLSVVREAWEPVEEEVFKKQTLFEKKVLKVQGENLAKARKMLSDYTGTLAAKIWKIAKDLAGEFE